MMNKILKSAIILALGVSSSLTAQFRNNDRPDKLEWIDHKKYNWGFFINGNHFDYKLVLDPTHGMKGKQSLVESKPIYGFGAGLIGKMRLNDYLDLRLEPGLQLIERELTFKGAEVLATKREDIEAFTKRKVKSTYIDVPLLLEFHGLRWYNSRPYIAGGVNWLVNLQSHQNSTEDNLQGTFRTLTHNFAWSAELGIQFYFSKFKLTPAIRGTFVLNNELVADNPETPKHWAGALSSINTRAFMLVLKFE
ncbi:MAG: porin family protein [Flavobacteriaceae bacterium]|nr:porin family protein [Flavobacteriaceae bacterium]